MLITRMETDKTLAVIPPREYEIIKKAPMTGAIYLLTELIDLIPLFVTLYIFSTYL